MGQSHVKFVHAKGPFINSGLTLIPAWRSNHMFCKMWDGITYPFPNFNSWTDEVWEWISNLLSHLVMDMITYQCQDWSETMLVKWALGIWLSYSEIRAIVPIKVTAYHQTSNIRCTLVDNKIVDQSDVVGALPVSAAPTTSSLST